MGKEVGVGAACNSCISDIRRQALTRVTASTPETCALVQLQRVCASMSAMVAGFYSSSEHLEQDAAASHQLTGLIGLVSAVRRRRGDLTR